MTVIEFAEKRLNESCLNDDDEAVLYWRAYLDGARAQKKSTLMKWISVKDRLPEEKVNCIVHYQNSYCDNDGYWAIGFCCYDGEKFQFDPAYKVTHWMPLPEPPKEGICDEKV